MWCPFTGTPKELAILEAKILPKYLKSADVKKWSILFLIAVLLTTFKVVAE